MAKTIVVIEDDKESGEIIRMGLEEHGLDIDIQTDGLSGLEAVRSKKPDAVILDIKIPKMNGYEVCTAVQSDEALRHIPIMILTGLTTGNETTDDQEWKDRMEVADFMSKPFDIDDFTHRVLAMLDQT